ncbi:RNA-directed DNA polymerase, eukaryota, partial [Tanacetum coccineum]
STVSQYEQKTFHNVLFIRFYNYWLEKDGFDKLVMDAWNDAPGNKRNVIRNFMCKLKFTKERIRGWLSSNKSNWKGEISKLKEELSFLDEAIDKGNGSEELVQKRLIILNKIQQISNITTIKTQKKQKNKADQMSESLLKKAKIKWVVEGDENTKFFHGMLNKKRSQSNIRGIMANGKWIDNPVNVKNEFFDHFRCRFDKPPENRARIDICFPNVLSNDQRMKLDPYGTKEDDKKGLCGLSVRSGVEESQFNSLLEIVQVTNLVPCEDRYRWSLESDGMFSVASIRKLIDEQRFQEVGLSTRWVKSVPSKVNITAWKIKTNALPTRFNLSCRRMDIDSIMCPICNGGVETTSHLFFQCELIKLKGMMEGVFYGLWWSIWNFCNKILFEDKPPKKALLFDNLVSNSFNWCKYRCKASFKWDDWLKNPYLVCV